MYEKANQIAHVLVDDLGLVSGNRVLLRSANNGTAAIVNPLGIVEQKVEYGDSGYVDFKKAKKIQPTLFSKYGNKIFITLILLYIFIIFSFNRMNNEQS